MLVDFLVLLLGLFILIKSADFLVDSLSNIATLLKIHKRVIGLTLAAFGTSFPELVVNIISSLKGYGSISLGDAIGSNITNAALILPIIVILMGKIYLEHKTVWKENILLLLTSFILFFMSLDLKISREEGLILLTMFVFFLSYIIETILGIDGLSSYKRVVNLKDIDKIKLLKNLVIVIISLAFLYLGGRITIDSIISLSDKLGISKYTLSGILVALGTSLPELVVSVISVLKGEKEIGLGNVIGSNLFNISVVLAISSIINPISLDYLMFFHIILHLVIVILIFIYSSIISPYVLVIIESLSLFSLYVLFIITNFSL